MALRVRYGNPADSGVAGGKTELVFGDTAKEVTFGRQTDRDVGFAEGVNAVSRKHFSIKYEAGDDTYIYNVTSGKPVFRNGQALFDGDKVGAEDRLNLGRKDGPQIIVRAETAKGGNMRPTEELKSAGGEVGGAMRSAQSAVNRLSTVALVTLLLVGGLGGGLAYFGATQTSLKGQIEALGGKGDMRIAESQRASLYLVAMRTPSGELEAHATAFAVAGPGGTPVLATNAHVTALFEEAQKVGKEIVGVPAGGGAPVRAVRAVTHPGYPAFEKFQERMSQAAEEGPMRTVDYVPAYDVGYFEVEDPAKLKTLAPLASSAELDAIRAGHPLMYSGFPMEGVSGVRSPAKPEPTVQTGNVTSIVPFLMLQQDDEKPQLIQHSLPLAGGASGSPIYNRDGKVVGLANAGSVVGATSKGRIVSAALVNFGQRADVLTDLIEGRTDEAWLAALEARFTAELAAMKQEPDLALQDAEVEWSRTEEPKPTALIAGEKRPMSETYAVANGDARPAATVTFDSRAGHVYKVLAASRTVKLSAAAFQGGVLKGVIQAAKPILILNVPSEVMGVGKVEIKIFADPAPEGSGAHELSRVSVYEVGAPGS